MDDWIVSRFNIGAFLLTLRRDLGPGDNLGFRLIVEKTIKFLGRKRLKFLWPDSGLRMLMTFSASGSNKLGWTVKVF